MKQHVLVLEDITDQATRLSNLISRHYEDVAVTCTYTAKEATSRICSCDIYSIFIIDISLSKDSINQDGLDFAASLRENEQYKFTPIIFITGYPNYVLDAINETHCYSFLIKPYKDNDVISQLDEIFKTDKSLTIRTTERIFVKLDFRDIYYIESIGRYMHFHTKTNGEIISRQHKLSELEKLLPDDFARCHRSFIINKAYLNSISKKDNLINLKEINAQIPFTYNYQNIL